MTESDEKKMNRKGYLELSDSHTLNGKDHRQGNGSYQLGDDEAEPIPVPSIGIKANLDDDEREDIEEESGLTILMSLHQYNLIMWQHSTDDDDCKDEETGSMASSIFNILNTIIGAGIIEQGFDGQITDVTKLILGIPYSFRLAGLGLGIIILTLVAIISDYGLIMLIKAGTITDENSYRGVMTAAFGKPGHVIALLTQFLYPFIALMGYCVVVGDIFTKVFRLFGDDGNLLTNRQFVISAAILLIMGPLCYMKKISKLGWTSCLSFICVVILVIVAVIRVATLETYMYLESQSIQFAAPKVPQALAIMQFTFVCHYNIFIVYRFMKKKSEERISRACHTAVGISYLLCLVLGIAGYLTFLDATQADILQNYCVHDVLVNVARICYGISVMTIYPLDCFACRETADQALFPDRPKSTLRRVVITTCVILGSLPVPLITSCLGTVLELNGSLTAAPIGFIFPAACYLKIAKGSLISPSKLAAGFIVVLGTFASFLGTIYAIIGAKGCGHHVLNPWCNETMFSNDSYITILNNTLK
ncbi:putative sodium-coupled neutral amino acid transporter 11 [Trichoplax sp. H2]|nr:putative sodium-coupled neutral amino acid transporter 11 [Trichoplax sp. H2]|eukprot:RDD45749.1 putative sodium-coupled neutral amino acid transporter 11 [Trichoplax sp. H2]